ncbi:MAG: ribokinase [Oscillospiraceae bacterium]
MSKVYVLGSMNIDLTYNVDKIPTKGLTVSASETFQLVGGKGFNQSVASCWTGAETSIIGALGSDSNSSVIRKTLEDRGVDCSHLQMPEGYPTGSAVIFVDKHGANLIVVHGGANKAVAKRHIDFAAGDFLAAQLETNIDAVQYYFECAKNAGATTVLNPSPYEQLPAELVQATDIVVANEYEASLLLGCEIAAITELSNEISDGIDMLGIKTLVITLGEDGAAICTKDSVLPITPFKANTVDTQGAGDAFLGVFVASLANGVEIEEAACFANYTASKCVEVKGSTLASLPNSAEQTRADFGKTTKQSGGRS